MELKLKEKVNIDGITLKQKMMNECIGLMGDIDNFTVSDIEFNLMLVFVSHLIEEDLEQVLDKSSDLLGTVEDSIEPIFKAKILANENYKMVFQMMVNDLATYFERKIHNSGNSALMVRDFLKKIQDITPQDIEAVLKTISQMQLNRPITHSVEKEVPVEEVKDIDKENERLLNLINQYKTKKDVAE